MVFLLSFVWTNLQRQTGRGPFSRIKVRTRWRPNAKPRFGHSCAQPAVTVSFVAGYKGRLEMNAGRTNGWLGQALLARCMMRLIASTGWPQGRSKPG